MKRFLIFLLVFCMAIMVIPFFTVNAVETVVYLKNGGGGDGTAPDRPVGTLAEAYNAIGAVNNGRVVVIGSIDFPTDANFTEPEHKGVITITGSNNGTDYKAEIFNSGSKHWILNGPTTFDDVELCIASTMVIRARNNPIVFTEKYETTGSKQLYLVGGNQGTDVEHNLDKDIHITMKGGTFLEVITFARSGVTGEQTGKAYVYVGGNAEIAKLCTGNRSISNYGCGSVELTLDGGVITTWAAYGDAKTVGHNGTVTVNITGNFNIALSFNAAVTRITTDAWGSSIFNGLSGAAAFYADGGGFSFEQTMVGTDYTLNIDEAVYDAVMATDKINTASFKNIIKTSQTAQTTAAVTTAAATTAAATTSAATTLSETEPTSAQTGDTALILTLALSVAVTTALLLYFRTKKQRFS